MRLTEAGGVRVLEGDVVPPPAGFAVLREDAFYILREDGFKILRE